MKAEINPGEIHVVTTDELGRAYLGRRYSSTVLRVAVLESAGNE